MGNRHLLYLVPAMILAGLAGAAMGNRFGPAGIAALSLLCAIIGWLLAAQNHHP